LRFEQTLSEHIFVVELLVRNGCDLVEDEPQAADEQAIE
jgi:hypothetical protein